jgi:hypothetical protein
LPSELLAGLCSHCLAAREKSWGGEFGLETIKDKKHCMECHQAIEIGAYIHWDVLANSFSLLCIACSEKAIAKAAQYRGTPFGRAKKAE